MRVLEAIVETANASFVLATRWKTASGSSRFRANHASPVPLAGNAALEAQGEVTDLALSQVVATKRAKKNVKV